MRIAFISLGLWFIIYHKAIGTKAVPYQQRLWKSFHFKEQLGPTTEKLCQLIYLIMGLLFLMFGILGLFQIIKG